MARGNLSGTTPPSGGPHVDVSGKGLNSNECRSISRPVLSGEKKNWRRTSEETKTQNHEAKRRKGERDRRGQLTSSITCGSHATNERGRGRIGQVAPRTLRIEFSN